MRISVAGALIGAAIGAAARSTVVLLIVGPDPVIFILPSAAIGVLVGLIAGGIGKPLKGALLGAFLSAVVFELFMLPCVSLSAPLGALTGDPDAKSKFLLETLVYALEMGVAGFLAGAL